MSNFWTQVLKEPSGKTSIKRVMLFVWFIIICIHTFLGGLTWEMITVLGVLLTNKSIEAFSELNLTNN